jgi:hypothetical protein
LVFILLPEILYADDDERNRLRYFGQLSNGIPNGHGTMAWKDGQTYKGTEQLKKLLYYKSAILKLGVTTLFRVAKCFLRVAQ